MGWRHTISSVIATNRIVPMYYTTYSAYMLSPSVVTPLLIVVIIHTSRWSTSNTGTADTAIRHDGLMGCLGQIAHCVVLGSNVLVVWSRSCVLCSWSWYDRLVDPRRGCGGSL